MIVDIISGQNITTKIVSPDTVGAFPIREDITVLPPDDPKKLRLGLIFMESPWTRILGVDDCYAIHSEKSISIHLDEMFELSDRYKINIKDFERLLLGGLLDADMIGFWVARIRENKDKDNNNENNSI